MFSKIAVTMAIGSFAICIGRRLLRSILVGSRRLVLRRILFSPKIFIDFIENVTSEVLRNGFRASLLEVGV